MRSLLAITFLLPLCFGVPKVEDPESFEDEADDYFFQFVSRPDILAPRWDIKTIDDSRLQKGYYWFTSPYENVTQETYPHWIGPHIYDDRGELIWSGAAFVDYTNSHDFRMSIVNGQQMLSFIWASHRGKNGYILDNSYEVYNVIDMVEDRNAWNIHELELIDDGKRALIFQRADFTPMQLNVPEYNGSCNIAHSGFEEVDTETGEVYFSWLTGPHIKLEETTYVSSQVDNDTIPEKCQHAWDIAHLNSVDKFANGDYLISARHTNTLYRISHKDGSILWRAGGIWSDFVFANEKARFSRQHCARIVQENSTHILISLFDNATGGGNFEEFTSISSSGMILALRTDTSQMTVELLSRYPKPQYKDVQKFTASRGSMAILPNGNAFMGWATKSHISEHTHDGQLLMTAMFAKKRGGSYRTYKLPWVGKPVQPPDVVAAAVPQAPSGGNLTTVVHVSWNGATEVSRWALYRSDSLGEVTAPISSLPRQGFETKFTVQGFAPHVIVVALDRNQQELGRSDVIAVQLAPDLHTPALAQADHQWISNHLSGLGSTASAKLADLAASKFGWFLVGFICCAGFYCAWYLWPYVQTLIRRREFRWNRDVEYRPLDNLERYEDDDKS